MEKTCDNCGKREDCVSSNATWSCHDNSAWAPVEPNIYRVYVVKQHWDYEGYHLVGCFSTEAKAIEVAEKLKESDSCCDGITVEKLYIDEEYCYDENEKIIIIK